MTTFSEFRERVRERTALLSIVEQTCEIKNRGSRVIHVRCPFHGDDTPSCAIFTDQDRWYCFGSCQAGGDVFEWISKRDGVDHFGAVEVLARALGWDMPNFGDDPIKAAVKKDAGELLQLAADFYHQCLVTHDGAAAHRDYLEKRGFGADFWDQWHVGAAGDANGLLAYLRKQGADLILAQQIGLIRSHDNQLHDYFRGRVVIPWMVGGQAKFFTGRAIDDRQPKYLHLPNTQYAQKSAYGGGKGKIAVVVEGAFDVWAAERLADEGIAVIALMGLSASDPKLQKWLQTKTAVYIGLDADGTVSDDAIFKVASAGGISRTYLMPSWAGGDDAAAWWASGDASPDRFATMLDQSTLYSNICIDAIKEAEDKAHAVDHAVKAAVTLDGSHRDVMLTKIKQASRGVIQARTIDELAKQFAPKPSTNGHGGNGAKPDAAPNSDGGNESFYYVKNGELWCGHGDKARRILAGGTARYVSMVNVDDGESKELELELEIALTSGRKFNTRVTAESSHEPGKLAGALKKVCGPLITVEAKQGPFMVAGIEMMSRDQMDERWEIAKTGWFESDAGLAFCTPGGVVGALPAGVQVKLPDAYGLYAIADEGDDAMVKAMDGVVNGLLKAFDPSITYPAFAFAILPPLSKWLGRHKFAMHFSGETGSLKTETALVLNSFYGSKFVDNPPLVNWRSTINSIEKLGFFLPNCMGVVDDYKPRDVKLWDFVSLIQRYADGNDRRRMDKNTEVRTRQAMRWWLLSTGEDIPNGESSVLARMLMLRFPRRPSGAAYNAELGKAQRLARFFPTIMARWCAWLIQNGDKQGFEARLVFYHQKISEKLQQNSPDVPNVNRISRNIAMLVTAWEGFWAFAADTPCLSSHNFTGLSKAIYQVAINLAYATSQIVTEEKPSKIFLSTLQEGLDSGRFKLLFKNDPADAGINVVGWFDSQGVYLLPAAFNEVSKWLRESGQQLGFSKQELYRLLNEEGLLARVDKTSTAVVIQTGQMPDLRSKRVLHLKRGALTVGSEGEV